MLWQWVRHAVAKKPRRAYILHIIKRLRRIKYRSTSLSRISREYISGTEARGWSRCGGLSKKARRWDPLPRVKYQREYMMALRHAIESRKNTMTQIPRHHNYRYIIQWSCSCWRFCERFVSSTTCDLCTDTEETRHDTAWHIHEDTRG